METMYYLGGYYLLRPKPLEFGLTKGKVAHTTSPSINEELIGPWACSWCHTNEAELVGVKQALGLNDEDINRIQAWVDKKIDTNKLDWVGNFTDLETVVECRETFFSHLSDVHIYSIYLSASDSDHLISRFEKYDHDGDEFRLRRTLLKKIKEQERPKEVFLGYDLIGVEEDGRHYSFYCHDATQKLMERFGLTLNANGLFEETEDWQPVKDFINVENNGFEPVPWYVAKTKMITI